MKLYTEEQIIEAYNRGRTDWINEIENDNILSNLTPIELPSDEEIEESAEYFSDNHSIYDTAKDDTLYGFREGANWMKEQILNQNK